MLETMGELPGLIKSYVPMVRQAVDAAAREQRQYRDAMKGVPDVGLGPVSTDWTADAYNSLPEQLRNGGLAYDLAILAACHSHTAVWQFADGATHESILADAARSALRNTLRMAIRQKGKGHWPEDGNDE